MLGAKRTGEEKSGCYMPQPWKVFTTKKRTMMAFMFSQLVTLFWLQTLSYFLAPSLLQLQPSSLAPICTTWVQWQCFVGVNVKHCQIFSHALHGSELTATLLWVSCNCLMNFLLHLLLIHNKLYYGFMNIKFHAPLWSIYWEKGPAFQYERTGLESGNTIWHWYN